MEEEPEHLKVDEQNDVLSPKTSLLRKCGDSSINLVSNEIDYRYHHLQQVPKIGKVKLSKMEKYKSNHTRHINLKHTVETS